MVHAVVRRRRLSYCLDYSVSVVVTVCVCECSNCSFLVVVVVVFMRTLREATRKGRKCSFLCVGVGVGVYSGCRVVVVVDDDD